MIPDLILKELKTLFPNYTISPHPVNNNNLQIKLLSNKDDFDAAITDETFKKLSDIFNTEDINIVGYRKPNSSMTLRGKRLGYKDYMCTIDIKNFELV